MHQRLSEYEDITSLHSWLDLEEAHRQRVNLDRQAYHHHALNSWMPGLQYIVCSWKATLMRSWKGYKATSSLGHIADGNRDRQ